MGNGSSAWTALTYFANAAELAAIIDGAPDLLNTLNELAASIGDDPAFLTTIATNLSNHATDTTGIHGIADTAQLATLSSVNESISDSLGTHTADTTQVHGIANTALLVTTADLNTSVGTTASDAAAALLAHGLLTENVHGIGNTANLATTSAVNTVASDASAALSTHASDTTAIHGIADTAQLATLTNVSTAASDASAALAAHASDTTDVHGINNFADLATKSYVADAVAGAEVNQSALAGVGLDWNGTSEAFDIDSTVATKTYADDAVSTHDSDTTNVHGIANTALLATTADVAAVTKTSLGLGNVDNTADTAKPVSTAQSSAIATAKAEAIADATSQVSALLAGAPAALNTLDELAAALGDDANFAATVTTNLGLKVDSLTPISQKTASYTLSSLTERDDLIEMGSASALTLTIPPASAVDYPIGTSIDILQTGAGQVTVAAGAGVTVNATPGLKLRTTWSSATLFKRAANTWVVFGDLTA
jgi:hypothetical protein